MVSHLQYQPLLPSGSGSQGANAKSISQGSHNSSSNNSDDDDSVDQVICILHFMVIFMTMLDFSKFEINSHALIIFCYLFIQELKLVHIEMYKMKLRERERRRRVAREHQVYIFFRILKLF